MATIRCIKCQSEYFVDRRYVPPAEAPACECCGHLFAQLDGDDWLHYRPAWPDEVVPLSPGASGSRRGVSVVK
jgi:NAD-dependent SIR2 family protein deacetylase